MAGPLQVEIKGQKLLLSPNTVRDLRSIPSYMRTRALQEYNASTPKPDGTVIMAILAKQYSDDEINAFGASDEGIDYMLWRSLNHKQPSIGWEDMGMLFDMSNSSEYVDAIRLLNSLNSAGERPLAQVGDKAGDIVSTNASASLPTTTQATKIPKTFPS